MKKHATMRGAGVPRCNDVPDTFNVLFHETYRENGPHGSTGCAEGFQSAGHVSILNAIADAVGVRVATLPVTPEKLKAAMTAKAAGVPYGQFALRAACLSEGTPCRKGQGIGKAAPVRKPGTPSGSRAMAFGLFERGIPVLLHLIEEIQRRAVHAILLLPQGKFMQERDRAR